MTEYCATATDAGLRLDVWLERCLSPLSRARVQALIRAGHITVAGRPTKPHQKVRAGLCAHVTIPPPQPVALTAEAIPLDILYEDADVIVLNKPAGLVVHPAAGHAGGTLVNALLHHCHDLTGIGGELRPGIVHRLDKDTTGVMVVAKTEPALHALADQFKHRGVRKEYLAIVHGIPRPAAGTIESLIGRSTRDRKKMSAQPARGRHAVTHYRIEEALGAFSLLRLRIETGRTHQIRVHLAHIGHPVAGDPAYGRRHPTAGADRQMLHAAQLAFLHPRTGAALEFSAALPPDMAALRLRLRATSEARR